MKYELDLQKIGDYFLLIEINIPTIIYQVLKLFCHLRRLRRRVLLPKIILEMGKIDEPTL